MNRFKIGVTIMGLITMLLIITGCNTVKGFGKDVQSTGSAIERAAD